MTRLAAQLMLVLGLATACASDDRLPDPEADLVAARSDSSASGCIAGAARVCATTVGQSGNTLTCYEGHQVCDDGQWSPCQDGTLVERAAVELPGAGSGTQLRARAGAPDYCNPPWVANPSSNEGGAGGAGDGSFGGVVAVVAAYPWYNPCDPQCRYFEAPPPLVPDSAGGAGGSADTWQEGDEVLVTGTVGSLPPDVLCGGDDLCDSTLGVRPAGCHPCVDAICLADPYCCATDWDDICVAEVYTVCLGVPTPPSASVCEYSIFSETTMHLGNRVDIQGLPVGANGDLYLDEAKVDGAISGSGMIDLNNKSIVRGDARAATTIDIDGTSAVWGAQTTGVVTAMQSVPDKNLVCPGGESDVIDLPSEVKTISPGDYGAITLRGGRTLVLDGAGTYNFQSLHIDDGSVAQLVIPATGTVLIDTCDELYFGNTMELLKDDGAGGTVPLDPSDALRLQWYTEAGAAKIPTDMQFFGSFVAPNATVQIFSRSPVYGLVYASAITVEPDIVFDTSSFSVADCQAAGIDLGGAPPGAGTCPVDLSLPGTPDLIHEPCRSGLDCQLDHRCTEVNTEATCDHAKCEVGSALDASCDPCVALVCAADSTCCSASWTSACVDLVPTECDAECDAALDGGVCVPNDPGYQDPNVTGAADLSLGVPCEDTIPVCNHGDTDAPPGVEITAWPLDARQVSVTDPDFTLAAGDCATTEVIPAGQCRSVSCSPALLDEPLTLMVNADGAIAEYSRLDNWSGYVDGVSCTDVCVGGPPCAGASSLPVTTTFAPERYEAVCPAGSAMSPQWGLMVWRASDLGTGTIDFEVRTAATAAELAAAPWVSVATAQTSPVDTSVCPKLSAPPDPRAGLCPVDLFQQLNDNIGVEAPYQRFLELQITIDPDAATSVSLDEWELTYTCQFSE